MTKTSNNIVVLGGSFNPPTIAHVNVLDTAIKNLNAKFGLFVPSSNNYVSRKMKRQNGTIFSENSRLQMLSEICKNHPNMHVDTCEFGDDGRGHTYDTLCKIQAKYPDSKIVFIIGADKLSILPRWHNANEFFEKFEFAVIPRENFDINKIINNNKVLSKYKHIFHTISIPVYDDLANISSTQARKAITQKDIVTLQTILEPSTYEIIKKESKI